MPKYFHHCWPEKGHPLLGFLHQKVPDANLLHKLLERLVDSETRILTITIVGLSWPLGYRLYVLL